MVILGIETSCDETAVSIIDAEGDLESLSFKVLGSAIHSQIDMHKEFGGVVPNLAKREHIKNLPIVLDQALKNSGLFNHESKILNLKFIDLIAVTVGPGLEPALWTGIEFAKKLSEDWGVPVIGVNHMLGHIASVLLTQNHESKIADHKSKINFPAMALLISGGHTELVLLKSWTEIEKIGETLDDAVGEAFDKVARMMGLPYPGGPEISKLAEQARSEGIVLEKKFPRPMIHSKDFNFSFSGLKTAVLYYLRNISPSFASITSRCHIGEEESGNISINEPCEHDGASTRNFSAEEHPCEKAENIPRQTKLAIAREFEDAVIETLLYKTKSAIETHRPKTLIIGGGVIANKALREKFGNLKGEFEDLKVLIPEKSLTTDNATMIACAGYIEHLKGKSALAPLKANGNLSIEVS